MQARSLILLSILAAVSACEKETTLASAGSDFGPLLRFDTTPSERMDGIWQSRGYGWLFDINGEDVRQYQVAGPYCFATPDVAAKLSDTLTLSYDYYKLGENADTAILQLLPDDTEIWIDRLDSLPDACMESVNDGYADILSYFDSMMAENYAFFERRNIDWPARKATARAALPDVSNEREFFELLAGAIDGFSDSHTKLIANIDGEMLRQQDGLGPTLTQLRSKNRETAWIIGLFTGLMQNVLDPGSQHTANDRILWGMIDERIGYIQVLVMGGYTGTPLADPNFREAEFKAFDEVMDSALYAMKDAEFVIVDLSNNRGGYDAISRRLVSRFTKEPALAYVTEVPGSGVPARDRVVEPAEKSRYTGPVLLLTSDVTVSGGEIATLGFRALPNVTHMGGVTRGSFSTVLAKPLPNGWVVELSNEVYSDADGNVYEETGIRPKFDYTMFPADNPVDGYFEALDAAILRMSETIALAPSSTD